MAYIDKKSAIDALKAIRYGLWEIDIPSPTVPEYVEHHEQIKNMMEITDGWIKKLEEQPTADVVERKRGKWVKAKPRSGKVGIVCSSCGNEAYWDSDYGQQLFDWCPYCGSYNGEESENE